MRIAQEEVFGPVLAVIRFEDEAEAIRIGNDVVYGLAAAVWTKDISQAHKIARQIRAGNVWVNCYNVFDAALPFGGYKQPGWGREMGHAALEQYTETKAVTVRLS